jgi:hypothetical protein
MTQNRATDIFRPVYLFYFILCILFTQCKKKSSSQQQTSPISDNLGIVALNDTVVNFKDSEQFYFLDLDDDKNADFVFQYHVDWRGTNSPGMAIISGNNLVMPVQNVTGTVTCVTSKDTTKSTTPMNMMQKWNFSNEVVSLTDTAGCSPLSLIYYDTHPVSSPTICVTKSSSKAGDKNEGYIVLRKKVNGKLQMGWIRCRYKGGTDITFISYKKFMDTESLKLP